MQTIELTAKTVQEATKLAAEKLGTTPDAVKVTVLEEIKGLFGKSTVRVRAEAPEPKAAPAPKAPKAAPAPKAAAPAPAPVAAPEPEAEAAPAPKRGGGRAKKAAPVSVEAATPAEEAANGEGEDAEGQARPEATAADGEQLHSLLVGLLASGDLDVQAEVTEVSGRYVNIKLDGKDVAFLVGKHGEVLNALQYLLNIIAARKVGNGVRATLDGNDFRKRREDKLAAHAKMVADEVIKRGEEAVLDAMPAFDRRIVHKALGEYPGVSTYSEGEEPNRRVVIAPAD